MGDADGDVRTGDLDGGAVDPARPGGRGGGVVRGGEAEGDEVAQPGLEAGRAVVGDDLAVVDHHHPVGDGVGLLEVVRGQQDRGAELTVEALHLLLQVDAVLRVEPGGRLVEEHQPRPVDQADRHVEAAALAAGEGRDRAAGVLGEVEGREQLLGPLPCDGPGQPVRAGLADDLVPAALLVPGGVALPDVPDRAAYGALLAHDVVPRDLGRARRRGDERGQHAQRRRLAGAVGSEEGDQLAVGHLEVEPADGLDRLLVTRERLGECLRPDHRTGAVCGHAATLGGLAVRSCPLSGRVPDTR